MSFEDYSELAGTGYEGGSSEPTPPEDEFFHSLYVAGKSRKNHINILEESGKFQIRGVQYNLDEIHMIITHTKEVLCKTTKIKDVERVTCFSFKEGAAPWYGFKKEDGSPRQCPPTSAERATNSFCSPCRAQIIVAGIYCKPDGSPILTEDKKPIFIFIRGKGMKYSNVSDYLNDCFNSEYPPLFSPATEQSKEFEKRVVNNKRAVTKITKVLEQNSFGGSGFVFVLTKGTVLPNDGVIRILELSKKTLTKFNEKFDWSKGKQATTSYAPPSGVLTVDKSEEESDSDSQGDEASTETTETAFSFDDIVF